MEIDADDAEPIHITGEGGNDLKCHMTILTTSYNNHTILDQPPKCRMTILTTSYDNRTILGRPAKCHI